MSDTELLRQKLEQLRLEHRDLDDVIARLSESAPMSLLILCKTRPAAGQRNGRALVTAIRPARYFAWIDAMWYRDPEVAREAVGRAATEA